MGVTTQADIRIQEAKDHLAGAYKALLIVMDEETYGHGDFKEEYLTTVSELAMEILKWKRKL